jgi:membrane protein
LTWWSGLLAWFLLMPNKVSRLRRLCERARELLDERGPRAERGNSKWRRFVHFWVLVWVSFSRNRCPVRASALAYASLLALIPMLAVAMSFTSTILKKQGEDRISQFIGDMVSSLTPPAAIGTNETRASTGTTAPTKTESPQTNSGILIGTEGASTNSAAARQQADARAFDDEKSIAARKAVAQKINEFIQNTRSGALGVTGSVLLIFAAISMLSRIEATFNDIWGVVRGRSWFMRIVLYWGVLTLAPILLVVALGLATGPHLQSTQKLVASLPFVGTFLVSFGFQLLPVLVLCLTFGAFYMLMPNTKVHWGAALVGGLAAGLLFHGNNMISVLYVSRVVTNSAIYGSLGLVPVFMIGLYFSWLIVLFGAQVAYAFQNRSIYAEERQVENINQRGREFIALRLMTLVGQRYVLGEPPVTLVEMAENIGVPTRLVQQIMQTLATARLAIETVGSDPAYMPARPIESITCHDILQAIRATQGQELATRDEPTRLEVFGEFQRIQDAERKAAASVTMLALVNRAQAQLQQGEPKNLVPAPR